MKRIAITPLLLVFVFTTSATAQKQEAPPTRTFEQASADVQRQLEDSLGELSRLREQIADQKVPLIGRLSELESELIQVRGEYQQTSRLLDSRTLDLSNLRREIKSREDEVTYLSSLLGEYIRNFESRLHIAEFQRYDEPLENAKLAPENSNLTRSEVFRAQAGLLDVSLARLLDALGGSRFQGTAVDSKGLVREGTFVLIGPAAIFRSSEGQEVGTAEQRLGSLEPAEILFADPVKAAAASRLITTSRGHFPLDPTLGNAHKIEATEETLLEHIEKGGVVMIPIFALAGLALLVGLYKWLVLFFTPRPSKKKVTKLLDAVARRDEEGVRQRLAKIKGPAGKMLTAAVEHIREPRVLIEEVMYERVLATRLRLNRFLPFIAICAASAPLLGLLGTVTGIINTFKMITVFGSGDVKTLSGGISEALITTEFGLIVAIPSLLLHAFLSRKARGIVAKMETTAIRFANQISVTPWATPSATPQQEAFEDYGPPDDEIVPSAPGGEPMEETVRAQIKKEILSEILSSMVDERQRGPVVEPGASRS